MNPTVTLKLQRIATSQVFRVFVALSFIAFHLWAFAQMAERFGAPFNAAPHQKIAFQDLSQWVPEHWNRLAVSRWDSQHYIDLMLRGFSQCPKTGPITETTLYTCQLNFYPGYSLLGWLISFGNRLPPDYTLFAISLTAAFVLLYTWTGPTMVRNLGIGGTYASLAAFNAFTSGYAIVAILTEPCLLAWTLLAFVCLAEKRTLTGAIFAGAGGGIRISGAALGPAYALGLLALTWLEPPKRIGGWIRRALEIIVSGWGLVVLLGYYYVKFKDPLAYVHAHSLSYHHTPQFLSVFWPKPEWIKRALYDPLHAGIWVFITLLWFLLGHRAALRRFSPELQVFCYALFVLTWLVPVSGSISLGLAGNSRYMLAVLPAFFAIGAILKRRPAALALWLVISLWFYWQADLCHFVGNSPERFEKCNDAVVAGSGY